MRRKITIVDCANFDRVKREDYKGYESLRDSDEMWRGQRIY